MTSQEPPQDFEETPIEEQTEDLLPERPQREARPRRQRPEPNPALDPRLAQLERRSRRPSRTVDASLVLIGIVAFVFGVSMHYWVATSVLDSGASADSSDVAAETPTPTTDSATITPTVEAQATATPLPDRTSCDEIRGTQYRSVSEREFFLANCTGGQPAAQPTQAPATQPTQAPETQPTTAPQ